MEQVDQEEYLTLQTETLHTLVSGVRALLDSCFESVTAKNGRVNNMRYAIALPLMLSRIPFFAQREFWFGLEADQEKLPEAMRYRLKEIDLEKIRNELCPERVLTEPISMRDLLTAINSTFCEKRSVGYVEAFFLGALEQVLYTDAGYLQYVLSAGIGESGQIKGGHWLPGGWKTQSELTCQTYKRVDEMLNRL